MNHTVATIIIVALIAINIITFILYGLDKHKAKKGKWRVPEATLLAFSFFGGSLGAILAMQTFHHKTLKPKFRYSVPLFFIIHTAIAAYLFIRMK